jgi:tRNA-splicing ligase RtcB
VAKNLNTNDILKAHGYGSDPRFVEIARWAASINFTDEKKLVRELAVKYGIAHAKPGMQLSPVPCNTFFGNMQIESGAYDQLKMALSIPPAVKGAALPDCHPGYSMPIGGVVALYNAISPSFVGLDIGCRMRLSVFPGIDPERLRKDTYREKLMGMIVNSTSFGLNSGNVNLHHEVMNHPVWNDIDVLRGNKQKAAQQLGSSGGSNHFCDLVVGTCLDGSLPEKFVALMTHSGSRGTGKNVADYYVAKADQQTSENYSVPKGYGWLGMDTVLGQEYWQAMNLMGEYASANHQIIHDRFAKLLGSDYSDVFENHHNFAWKENGLFVHRKGATPAGLGVMGVIPGSSGTSSFLVRGKGNEASLNSASHGAGRTMSRSKAKEVFDRAAFDSQMREISYTGVNPDEGFNAYKNIYEVMDAQKDLVDIVAVLEPKVVVMGGGTKVDDGD